MKHKHAEVIKAWADGDQIQFAVNNASPWLDYDSSSSVGPWDDFHILWRIKPKAQTYRVALLAKPDGNGFVAVVAQNQEQEEDFSSSQRFVRWLTDRIEYEV